MWNIPTIEDNFAPWSGQDVQQDLAVAPAPAAAPTPAAPAPVDTPYQLDAPPEFAEPYSEDEKLNPRTMLWAGTLADIGSYLASGGRQPMGNKGMNLFMQSHQFNNRQKAANQRALQQNYANKMAYAGQQRAAQQAAMQQAAFDQARGDREALMETGAMPGASANYNSWLQAGSPGTYAEWVSRAQRGQVPAALQTYNAFKNMSEEERRLFARSQRKPTVMQVDDRPVMVHGDGTFSVPGADGETKDFSNWNEMLAYMKQADKTSEGMGTLVVDQRKAVEAGMAALPKMRSQVQDMRDMIAAIDRGQYDKTGFVEGRLHKYNDPETAMLEVRSTLYALEKLNETDLAPVSNVEIELMKQLYADILSQPDVNKAKLQELAGKMEGAIAEIEKQGQWLGEHGNMLEYNLKNNLPQPAADPDDPYGGAPPLLRAPTLPPNYTGVSPTSGNITYE